MPIPAFSLAASIAYLDTFFQNDHGITDTRFPSGVVNVVPTLFLLDADKRVLQKNLRPDDYLGRSAERSSADWDQTVELVSVSPVA